MYMCVKYIHEQWESSHLDFCYGVALYAGRSKRFHAAFVDIALLYPEEIKKNRFSKGALHLHLAETVLPGNDVRSGTILTVVEQDNPERIESVKWATKTGDIGCSYRPSGFMDSPV